MKPTMTNQTVRFANSATTRPSFVRHQFQSGRRRETNRAAGLMQAPDGAFYGTTELGGSSGLGTVFKMTQDGTGGYSFRVIHDFSGPGGGNPDTDIVQGSDGVIYG